MQESEQRSKDDPTSTVTDRETTTRRSFLTTVGSVASVAAVPAVRATTGSGYGYGEGGYGAETYGGVS